MTSNCLKREGAAVPVVKVKRKYVRKNKSELEGGEVREVKSKRKYSRKDKMMVEPIMQGEVARRRYRCDQCNYSSNNQVSPSLLLITRPYYRLP